MAVIMILLGIVLITFSSYSIIKENTNGSRDKFSTVLKERQESVNDTDITIGEMRREFAETIMELQVDISELKKKLDIDNGDEITEAKGEVLNKDQISTDDEEQLTFNGVTVNDLDNLMKEGYTLDEISEKLEISKGEILLIRDLYLK